MPIANIMPKRTAFTLLELIIAIAIVGLILASVIPYIMAHRESARRFECAQNLHRILDAMNAYAKDNTYPHPRRRARRVHRLAGLHRAG